MVLTNWFYDAVLDKETGLVWELSPQATASTWGPARNTCINKNVGGRKGWRLPSINELASLIDPYVTPGPTLPLGHPFLNVQSTFYWSAATDAEQPLWAWTVEFGIGQVSSFYSAKTLGHPAWCVRGGSNADAY